MSVVGFDIGNENCVTAVAKNGGIDVLLNDESKRETPAVVSFGEKQRFLGSAGAAFATKYPKSTITQIKRLIGRQYKEESVQKELQFLPFETSEAPHGGILIHIEYWNERWNFMPVEILGMLFAHLKQMTEKNLGSQVADCVIGIPSYFTDFQRREYITAARIAGLTPLQLMHDCTAVALGYGMYKTDFSNEGPTNVMFVDIGNSDTQVMVAAFEKGKMTTLSHSFDQNLGGRDFDGVLFRHFAAKFKQQYNVDVCSNARASVRLRVSCEKLKKVLSANAEAPFCIECLIDDKDMNGFLTREEFENLSLELLERVIVVCRKAGNNSGLSANEIHTIELVGSGTRVPAISRKLASLFGKEPLRTLNGSECVARGCALSCAMLSPTFRVQDYKVRDIFPYSIGLRFQDGENRRYQQLTPFPKGSPFPSNKTLPYQGDMTFYCQFFYNNNTDFPVGISPEVGYFMRFERKLQPSKMSRFPKLMMLAKSLTDRIPTGSSPPTAHLAEEARSGCPRWLSLAVSENFKVVMTKDELLEAQEIEKMLAEQDIKVEQTKERRNNLESFSMKLVASVTTDSEEAMISKRLQESEEWLYKEGDDVSQQVYIGKLEYIKKLLYPIENRYKDELARKEVTKYLHNAIQEILLAADSLPPSQQKEVNYECIQVKQWLYNLSQYQDSLPKNATRMYCSSAIIEITQAFKRRCQDIVRSQPLSPKDNDLKQNPDEMQMQVDK